MLARNQIPSQTLAAAQEYFAAGFNIIPISVDGSKAPDGRVLPQVWDEAEKKSKRSWKQLQQERTTEKQVHHWFGCGVARGLGIILGNVSGQSEALDFDKPGLYDQFAEVCGQQGLKSLLDSLPLIETPSGGRHVLYRCVEPVAGNQKLAETPDRKTLIETRGEGGYIVAPGSPSACHQTGKPYRFLRGRPGTTPTISAEDHAALLDMARLFNEYADPAAVVDLPRKKTQVGDGLRPGDDYNARGDYESLLEQHGWCRKGQTGDKVLWQRPGKTGRGLSATSNYGGCGLFYVFSSNAAPFEPQKAYSPFAVYTFLEHGGDFSEAARRLGEEEYGIPSEDYRPTDFKQESVKNSMKPNSATVAGPGVFPAAETDWPEASPFMFHGLAGDIVRAVGPHTEADPVALLVQLLAAFGSAIGRSAHFRAEADEHFGNLFVVMVGISSKGRKGTSWGHVKHLFALADPQWEGFCIQTGLSSGEGLIWHVRDAVEKPVKNKATGEAELETVDPGIADKRLLVMESEYASVLRVASRDGNTLSAILRDAWDRGRLQTMTKNNAAKATGAHVSLIGHITADELRRELSSIEAGNGFANRFLWVCVRRSKELPEGGDLQEEALHPLAGRLAAVIEEGRKAGLLERDENARALWRAVYHDLSEGRPGLSGAVTSRGEAQTMRLALLYALLDGAEAIRREHLTAALALWDYVEASAKYVFGNSLGDPIGDDILRALRNAPNGMSRTEIRQLFQGHQSSNRIGQALALLLKHNRARVVSNADTGGRPTERWFTVRAGESKTSARL